MPSVQASVLLGKGHRSCCFSIKKQRPQTRHQLAGFQSDLWTLIHRKTRGLTSRFKRKDQEMLRNCGKYRYPIILDQNTRLQALEAGRLHAES